MPLVCVPPSAPPNPFQGLFFCLIKSNTVIKIQYWQGFQANIPLAKCLNTPNAI